MYPTSLPDPRLIGSYALGKERQKVNITQLLRALNVNIRKLKYIYGCMYGDRCFDNPRGHTHTSVRKCRPPQIASFASRWVRSPPTQQTLTTLFQKPQSRRSASLTNHHNNKNQMPLHSNPMPNPTKNAPLTDNRSASTTEPTEMGHPQYEH